MDHAQNELKTLGEKEAAELLGVAAKTLQGWRWRKTGPAYLKIGRRIRYRITDLTCYLDSQTVRAAQ